MANRGQNSLMDLSGKIVVLIALFLLLHMLWNWRKEIVEQRKQEADAQRHAREHFAHEEAVRRADEAERQRQERERHGQEEARKRAEQTRTFNSEKKKIADERKALTDEPVPPDIQRAMRDFLLGSFRGEDESPLAYVGYRVGKTNGLAQWDRHRRLKACFRADIPKALTAQYLSWGKPATATRFDSMCKHLTMLADMRRHRRNYEEAVAEWEEDEQWFINEFDDTARRFRKAGF